MVPPAPPLFSSALLNLGFDGINICSFLKRQEACLRVSGRWDPRGFQCRLHTSTPAKKAFSSVVGGRHLYFKVCLLAHGYYIFLFYPQRSLLIFLVLRLLLACMGEGLLSHGGLLYHSAVRSRGGVRQHAELIWVGGFWRFLL